jgi:Ca-activated chloride channel family protein
MINYFSYDYPQPEGDHPFSITTEIATAPWNSLHRLVRIGIQGQQVDTDDLPPSNLVFLLDVSGSMQSPDKLPLLKAAFRMLVNELRPEDRVAMVVYAGAAGLYDVARENHIDGGNNRVILATDGDFNVGASSDSEMVRLIEEKREQGTFLTVLGFGTGNLQDSKMEKLADHGNGNFAYIDKLTEARKVLVEEIGGTLLAIAKDVKIQVEFNPTRIAAYRLIGYENRLLRNEDFDDDTKDAGELGAGHSVTALYEVIPVGVDSQVEVQGVDSLRYQSGRKTRAASGSDELLYVKLRYKDPEGVASKLLAHPVADSDGRPSRDLRFVSAVAGFGMLLRDSEYCGDLTLADVIELAENSTGEDRGGYRAEFIRLVEAMKSMELLTKRVTE